MPKGRTTVARDASSAAINQRSFLTARNEPNSNATNNGSEPPRYERCSQSKFRMAKKPAIQPPQSRHARISAAKDAITLIASRDVRSEIRVTVERAAIA